MTTDQTQPELENGIDQSTYDHFLSIIDEQTNGEKPMVSKSILRQGIAKTNISHEEASQALTCAIDNGDVMDWHGMVVLIDDDSLLNVIERESKSSIPRSSLIAKCNRLRQQLREPTDESDNSHNS